MTIDQSSSMSGGVSREMLQMVVQTMDEDATNEQQRASMENYILAETQAIDARVENFAEVLDEEQMQAYQTKSDHLESRYEYGE